MHPCIRITDIADIIFNIKEDKALSFCPHIPDVFIKALTDLYVVIKNYECGCECNLSTNQSNLILFESFRS